MTLQLAFHGRLLYKGYDGKRFVRVQLVKISSRALIVDMLCVEIWSRVLIFASFISIVKVHFLIFFYKFTVSKVKSGIILGYIVVYRETPKRSKSSRKSRSESLLSLALHKKC